MWFLVLGLFGVGVAAAYKQQAKTRSAQHQADRPERVGGSWGSITPPWLLSPANQLDAWNDTTTRRGGLTYREYIAQAYGPAYRPPFKHPGGGKWPDPTAKSAPSAPAKQAAAEAVVQQTVRDLGAGTATVRQVAAASELAKQIGLDETAKALHDRALQVGMAKGGRGWAAP